MVEVPLFSGYIFGHFPLKHKLEVLQTVGIVRIVGLNGYPLPVPNEQIEAVQPMMAQHLHYDPHPFQEGMRVRVKRGILRGAEGILVAKKQHYRLVISVDLIRNWWLSILIALMSNRWTGNAAGKRHRSETPARRDEQQKIVLQLGAGLIKGRVLNATP